MNFYALSTPPGISGIAVIRLSGTNALQIANQISRTVISEPRTALLKKFYDQNGSEIDEGIIIWYPEGNSYTGDHVVEMHTHGSKAVVQKLMSDLDQRNDCRLAEPGEFTKTALKNNKMNLFEAESIADLLHAETEAQRVQALRLKNSSPKFVFWREVILEVLSKIEASIDFNGNTGPFIQYTYARIKTLINNTEEKTLPIDEDLQIQDKEKELIKHLGRYPEIIFLAGKQYSPAIVANYLYDLVKSYNSFYQNINILKTNNLKLRNFRISLSEKVAEVIKNAALLLGIEVPSRM